MFRPILGHLQFVSYSLESEVLWWQGVLYRWWDLIHLYISFCVAGVCRWLFWNGCIGGGGVLYRSCSLPIIVSSFSFCCTVLRNLLQDWCVPGNLGLDMLRSVGVKRKGLRAMWISVGVARMSAYGLHRVLTCETVLILSWSAGVRICVLSIYAYRIEHIYT